MCQWNLRINSDTQDTISQFPTILAWADIRLSVIIRTIVVSKYVSYNIIAIAAIS